MYFTLRPIEDNLLVSNTHRFEFLLIIAVMIRRMWYLQSDVWR